MSCYSFTKESLRLPRLKQAKARKQQLEAQKRAAESKRQRADDTRRKILVGAAILAKVDRGEWPKSRLLDMMGQTLTRPDDRALFGLDGKDEDAKEEPEQALVQR